MARKRLVLAVLALAAMAALAGCTSPFGGGVSEERLNENATYEWNASTDAYVNVTGGQYKAVYDVSGYEGTEFELWRPGIESRNPLPISALKYRYPNGTTVTAENLTVEESGGATVVTLPRSEGQVAFTTRTDEKSLVLPSYLEGSYEVVLPENMRVGFPLFGRVSPGADERTLEGDRVHLRFDELTRTLNVQWYLARDLWLFAGLVALLGVVGTAGVAYYVYQIRQLERKREDLGLDMSGDDDGRDPPPGMG
ncbi:hypothetical protein G9C85_13715 [Halorubellus sp. JP-L1]|uniref:DUF5803 family protein n=1 Tax=Halorubellus sp. JP-L1 TaxID=2715753 RepID=UPI0014075D62|nr:DUF5803 family protein [Halorubellus sp. JP-L1]NHN42679.1 hypothetical protein [Halorubellus sp. JP-L1]